MCKHGPQQAALPKPKGWLSRGLIGFVKLYRLVISPMLGANCRYIPTCSSYAIEAISLHGPLKGSAMSIWRIIRCNPFSKGGYDPVPGSEQLPMD
ncbi:MAG: membrane protein insertion efficiency factor YidD [Gammaproteobacteria bacterium]|jgi:hypothetical protein|nr:membrane protein insertion efficiency factor YidD [Gammaproteobacteria bacterium]MCP4878989.1 membrane protein insertion efficiency factor YidD [Gammaproteobacteria bacterium]MDP6166438.1 membrane protein insertion efficiency factor YidD [Gammaproteobacteria bacterium]